MQTDYKTSLNLARAIMVDSNVNVCWTIVFIQSLHPTIFLLSRCKHYIYNINYGNT